MKRTITNTVAAFLSLIGMLLLISAFVYKYDPSYAFVPMTSILVLIGGAILSVLSLKVLADANKPKSNNLDSNEGNVFAGAMFLTFKILYRIGLFFLLGFATWVVWLLFV